MITHFQFLSLLRFMNYKWETFQLLFLKIQSYIGDVSESTSSIDCLLKKDSELPGLYLKSLIFALFPYLIFGIIGLWCLLSTKIERKSKFTLVAMISLDLISPSVINVMFETITCFEFEENYYLRRNMEYECYTKNHILKVCKFIFYFINFLEYDLYASISHNVGYFISFIDFV